MFLFALPPGHGQALCDGDPLDPAAWRFAGRLEFTNPEALLGEGAYKPFVTLDPMRPGHAARIGGRYALLVVTDYRAKRVQRAWAQRLSGPWTLETSALIEPGAGADFDAKHVDAVSAYYFHGRGEILYFYMAYPGTAQLGTASAFGSVQATAVERPDVANPVRKLGPILWPASRPAHWARGWVGGLQLLPGRDHRWVGIVNASPTAPDPADPAITAEEPPPSLGGYAFCDEEWPVTGWRWTDEPIEWIADIPAVALAAGEGTNLWRHYALVLADGRVGLFYNSGSYFSEQLYLRVAEAAPG
jgi:hypothetical protein